MLKTKRHGTVVPNKAGWRPREEFVLKLRKLHPRIRIVWSDGIRQWLVMQQMPGGDMHLVFTAGRRFGEQSLRRKLRRCRVSKGNVEGMINALEVEEQLNAAAASVRASEKFQEGGDRLYSEFNKGSRVALSRTKNGRSRNRPD